MSCNLWIISETIDRDKSSTGYIINSIAGKLSTKYKVQVLTNDICASDYFFQKVNIKKLFDKRKNPNFILRLTDAIFFTIQVYWFLLRFIKNGDKVFLVSNPPLNIFIPALLKPFKIIESIFLVHDMFPENLFLQKKKKLLYKVASIPFNLASKSIDSFVVLGEDMKQILSSSKKIPLNKISIIENWFDPSITVNEAVNSFTKTELIFAGNIGVMQGLNDFLKITNKLGENLQCNISVYGDGKYLQNCIEINNNEKVNFKGNFNRSNQNEIYSNADLALVLLKPGMYGMGVPSKFYNLIRAGLPIIYIGDKNSYLDIIISTKNLGWSYDWNEITNINKFLLRNRNDLLNEIKVKKRNAINYSSNFTKEKILEKYLKLFGEEK